MLEPSASAGLLPVLLSPCDRPGGPPSVVRAHRVDAVRDVVELDGVYLVGGGDRILQQCLHGHGARNEEHRRELQLWLLDAPRLDVPVEHRLVRDDLWTAQFHNLSEKVSLVDPLDHAPGGVLTEDGLKLGLTAAGDDEKRAEIRRTIEVAEDAALLRQDEREAKNRAVDARLGQLL